MIDATLFAQVLDYSNRSNPYPLYARLREAPVARQENGIYVVSGFDEIRSLLFELEAELKGYTQAQVCEDRQSGHGLGNQPDQRAYDGKASFARLSRSS